jgi:hypothetical protein
MVRQVKRMFCMLAILCLLCATGTVAQAASYDVYDGSPSNTYIQYYRDLLGSISITDNYVVFRSGQYDYKMVVGEIVHNNGLFTSDKPCKVYSFTQTENGYNGYYTYNTSSIDSFVLDSENKIVYSDLGEYPQLEERGARYEILTTILIVAICVGFVCRSVFRYRPR